MSNKIYDREERVLYVRNRELDRAESILKPLEPAYQLSSLTKVRQAIFFRINSERYARLNNSEEALGNFKASMQMSTLDNLNYEKDKLAELKNTYHVLENDT